ncbi:hypothetical protein [Parachitinimonas caeni]|uniref:Uncharacterized protein n=1 Tax=Parachitinimonas caeni TaxID=3031301 RepID=A0ABT7E1A7_9NEIS|nr:hypothetical protein [Parachitinimonas caeni]MDK2125829.1 hypothetical protein [Parachitinimonas caeni]
MSFSYILRSKNEWLAQTRQYQHSLELTGWNSLSGGWVDLERDLYFFVIGRESNRERLPGEYFLFIGENCITIRAYDNFFWSDAGGFVSELLIENISFSDGFDFDQDMIIEMVTEVWRLSESSVANCPILDVFVKFS